MQFCAIFCLLFVTLPPFILLFRTIDVPPVTNPPSSNHYVTVEWPLECTSVLFFWAVDNGLYVDKYKQNFHDKIMSLLCETNVKYTVLLRIDAPFYYTFLLMRKKRVNLGQVLRNWQKFWKSHKNLWLLLGL